MDKQFEQGWADFLKLCTECKSTKELKELFDLFFTFEERRDIAMRYWIIKELLFGAKTQRELSEDLGISISKITRGSNALKIISDELKTLLAKKIK